MNARLILATVITFLIPFMSLSQQKDTLIQKLDSLRSQTDTLKIEKKNDIDPDAYNYNTRIGVKEYFQLLASDFKQQVTAPLHINKKDIPKIAAFALLTTAVAFTDKPLNRVAVDVHGDSKTVSSVSKYVTRFGGKYEEYTLAGLAAYGYIFKNEKVKTTVFLATHAYIVGGTIESTLKFITGRQRPGYIDPITNRNSPTFHGPFYKYQKNNAGQKPDASAYSAFPSGHATVAFAAATVFAMEYRDKPLIPIIAYSAATLVGISRVTENKHWPTDVLVGAALGFLSGRQVVNNYHRFAKLKAPSQQKSGNLTFNFNYLIGQFRPGLTYTFR